MDIRKVSEIFGRKILKFQSFVARESKIDIGAFRDFGQWPDKQSIIIHRQSSRQIDQMPP